MKALTMLATLALAACSGPAPDTSSDGNMTSVGSVERKVAVPASTPAVRDHTGRWISVEGTYLDIAQAERPAATR